MGVASQRAGMTVDALLCDFIETRALPGSGVAPHVFWAALAGAIHELGPRTRALLARRDALQREIDTWHRAHRGLPHDGAAYRAFLAEIGYLAAQPASVTLATLPADPEIAEIAGPQLVVPLTNARYALNAANARWGSLYDALYGTDALGPPPPPGASRDQARAARVIGWARRFLDAAVPLRAGSHADVGAWRIIDGALEPALRDPGQFAGHIGPAAAPSGIVLRNNGLHIIIDIDRDHPVGRDDPAHIADIRLESAPTAIMDLEDSVACVDAADKVAAYANWLGLMRGDLVETVEKRGARFERRLADDIAFTLPDGAPGRLRGRALMIVRNVGHLMTTPAILDRDGREAGEGIMDAFVTVLCALHDLRRPGGPVNSPASAVYLVKPKMHGPEEVAHAVALLERVEDAFALPHGTVRLGIMDEERRTSANLAACIDAARERIAFINTGFLDRTGDEIHTSVEAGPLLPKGEMKSTAWLRAYETRNVDIGLACGFAGRAQIGKGMWAAPDRMAHMLAEKIAHPEAGASCAWVPSPVAATLHATHYHRVDVTARQAAIAAEVAATGPRVGLDALLELPLGQEANWSAEFIAAEIDNNAQGILGYVVRWIDQGIGCSKVPDIHDVALMEDRATCRISSQAIANWLLHGIVTPHAVMAAMRRMAEVVDRQNADDPAYRPMAPGFDGPAFRAACALVFEGRAQPSGYTEPILHAHRAEAKVRRGGAA